MRNRSYIHLSAFIAFIVLVGAACICGTPTPTPSQPAPQPQPVTEQPQPTATQESTSNTNSGSLVTFTDQKNLYQIDVPSDWKHEHTIDKENNHYYIDTFTSPDGNAVVENIVYDDGTPFTGSDNGKFALQILNTLYSKTGKEGDIRISEEKVQADGSDRLTWTSKAGNYSGLSYFEIRKKTTFLMLTIDWANDFEKTYIDTLDQVIASYKIP